MVILLVYVDHVGVKRGFFCWVIGFQFLEIRICWPVKWTGFILGVYDLEFGQLLVLASGYDSYDMDIH